MSRQKKCLTCGDVHTCKDRMKKLRLRLPGRNVRRSDCNEEEKQRRGYTHPRSRVRLDGSEVLHGEDWRKRKRELEDRSDGACEMRDVMKREHAEECLGDMQHPHHVVARSLRRDDRLSNLAGLSAPCHHLLDPRKIRSDRAERREAGA